MSSPKGSGMPQRSHPPAPTAALLLPKTRSAPFIPRAKQGSASCAVLPNTGRSHGNLPTPRFWFLLRKQEKTVSRFTSINTATGQSNAPMVFMNASFTYADLKSMGSMAPGFLYKADGGYLGTFAFMTPRKFCPPTESNVIDTSKVVQIDLSKWNFYKCYK